MTKATSYTVLIVDDEASSRKSLTAFVNKYCKRLRIIATAENIIEAKKIVDDQNPDILLLDIEMPHGNAFDLLDQYSELPFQVIFITAFSQYAIQAFNLSNASYLLKPVDIEELISAVDKTCNNLDHSIRWEHTAQLLEGLKEKQLTKIVIPLMDGFQVIQTQDVIFIEAADNFSTLYLASSQKVMACRNLKFYEENLSSSGFLRIHRSTLINIDHVRQYNKGSGGIVTMSNGKQLDVAASRKKGFLEHFSG